MAAFDTVLRDRKSVRAYTGAAVEADKMRQILAAGSLAPSGKNGQPWRFGIVQKDKALLRQISALTAYDEFVRTADALLFVFLYKPDSYHYIKDTQAVGACIENMLLQCTALGLGACWIGEILNRDLFVKRLLGLDHAYDLMAMLSVGYPAQPAAPPRKKGLDELTLFTR